MPTGAFPCMQKGMIFVKAARTWSAGKFAHQAGLQVVVVEVCDKLMTELLIEETLVQKFMEGFFVVGIVII